MDDIIKMMLCKSFNRLNLLARQGMCLFPFLVRECNSLLDPLVLSLLGKVTTLNILLLNCVNL